MQRIAQNPRSGHSQHVPGIVSGTDPWQVPSGLVTGREGCMTGEMPLRGSPCRRAALFPRGFNRSRSLASPWGTLRAEGKRLLLRMFCSVEGLTGFHLTCKSQKIGANHFSPSLFTHMTHKHLPPTLVLLFLKVESLSCIWFNNNSSSKKKKISVEVCYCVRLDQKQFFKGGFQDS